MVEPGWTAEITALDHMTAAPHRAAAPRACRPAASRPDPVLLELFNNLFMNVAEQTGAVLQNTSMSVNIKERLDFSCAIFDAEGGLVANAPHVPVHLGAMGESVRTVLRAARHDAEAGRRGGAEQPVQRRHASAGRHGDHPGVRRGRAARSCSSSARRGHHADIGGITPGSTPPDSRTLEEEGVVIDDFLLVDGGHFREAEFRALLAGAKYPARSPDVNVADIKAQVAANEKGVQELRRVVAQYGWATVRAYMRHVMDNAEESVRRVLDRIGNGSFRYTHGQRHAARACAISVDRASRSAVVDFTGTGQQRRRQLQLAARGDARRGAVRVPLPGRRRHPAERRLPEAAPADHPARHLPVAGAGRRGGRRQHRGRRRPPATRCSARWARSPAAQATMNNFLFGDAHRQYYETICGGTGAGPGLRRHLGGADAHDQHPHDRPRGAGAALPGAAGAFRHPPRLRRRRQMARRRRRASAASASWSR